MNLMSILQPAAALLKQGQVVAFPTETVYGLGAAISHPEAIKKIYELKKRPSDNPLILHISNLEMLSSLSENISEEVLLLAKTFWPGPLTLILPKKPSLPSWVTSLATVAVRMPSHEYARALIELVGEPLAAPSANLSGFPSSTCPAHVRMDFGESLYCVEGGLCAFGIESTVLHMVDPKQPVLMRPGVITLSQLEEVLQRPIKESFSQSNSPVSPGQKYRHYAPLTPLFLYETEESLKAAWTPSSLVLSRTPLEQVPFVLFSSQTLYHLFRQADLQKKEKILIFCDPELFLEKGLWNRLSKAVQID